MEFDYVIVGAGSAGCVLANRLSADGKATVALVEAGGRDSSPWIHIPVGYFKTMGNPRTDWCFETEPDPGLNGRSIKWPRGKTLGGSSSINGLLYVRGQTEDYDGWRQMGNPGWGWEDVLPLFKRSEDWELNGSDLRGAGGPLAVSPTRIARPEIDAWIEAAEAAGYRRNPDYNGANQEGVGLFQLTARRGRRCSSAVAYLHPVANRQNLTVLVNHQTRRVIVEGSRATGIETQGPNGLVQIRARCEVVLSAGAIGSPQILKHSGIGPGAELQEFGIETRIDLPGVGQNLQDHLQARPVYRCKVRTINTESRSLFRKALMALEFALWRTGPMTMAASLGTGFLKTRPDLSTPDIQFHVQPFSADNPADGPHPFDAFTASVLQLRPESAGHLALKSPDPMAPPAIHPNYLATQTDCDTLVEGIRIARRIANTVPLSNLVSAEHTPGPEIAEDDRDAILNWARDTSVTIYHPTGTCKMGPDGDASSVVDPRLRVRGIGSLRVADASIMPRIVSGNTNAPAIMIGEKASDLILEDAAA